VDSVWQALLDHFQERAAYFQLFDRHRMRPDAWLKVEVLEVISELTRSTVRDVRPDRQGCDVWFSTAGGEYWLAVKGVITSYAGAPPGARPTLVSVEEVAREMDKLRGLSMLSGGKAALLLAALPMGAHPRERDEWQNQMLRFEAKRFELAGSRTIELRADREAHVYLFV